MSKLSIITICYNEKDLEDTCKSIAGQSFQDFEWIVIDGGSNKETLDIFEKYKKRIDIFVSEKDNGIYNAMNKGINLARGDYLLFLNAGDIFYEDIVLEKIHNRNFDEDIVYCDAMQGKGEKASKLSHPSPEKLNSTYFINSCLHHPSTLIKKELFNKFGLYNENYKIVSDLEKWIVFILKNKCTTKHLDIICACNDTNGISCNPLYKELLENEKEDLFNKYFTQEEIKTAKKQRVKYSFFEKIFSIKKSADQKHKILTIFGIYIKIKNKK